MKKNINKKIIAILLATQTLSMSTISYAAPDRILGRDRIMKWDYHRTYYDEDGNIKIKPKVTTFDTENENVKFEDTSIPRVSIPNTIYGNDVEILVNQEHYNSKQWLENIYKITKVDDNFEDNKNLESNIKYSIKDNRIILDSSSRPIDNNTIHNIKIYSNGFNIKQIPVHIVKKGSIILTGNSFAYNDILFKLEDFNYAITNPIYEVSLDNQVLKGNCDEYHIVSKIIRLEKNVLKKLTPGKHTLIVKAIGYEDFIKDFYLDSPEGIDTNFELPHENIYYNINPELVNLLEEKNTTNKSFSLKSVDATSSATKKPKPSSKDNDIDAVSSATGSLIQNVDLVFDFDLVANAIILERLNKSTDYSTRVVDRWNSAIIEYVQKNDDENLYTWNHYKDKVNQKKLENKYLSFEDYIKTNLPITTKNRGYAYKFVLENGLLGEIQRYDQVSAKNISLKSDKIFTLGENVILSVDDKDFLNSIDKIFIGSNQISKSDYTIDGSSIILYSNNKFGLEKNNIKILSKGYVDAFTEIFIYKQNQNAIINRKMTGIVISGLDEDFNKNFKGISINGQPLFNKSQVGSNEDFKFIENDIYIYDKNIKEIGLYNILISATGYENLNIKYVKTKEDFDIIDPVIEPITEDKTPEIIEDKISMKPFVINNNQSPHSNGGDVYICDNFSFETFDNIKEIYINENLYSKEKLESSRNFFDKNKGVLKFKDLSLFNKFQNKIIIKYKDLEDTVFLVTGITLDESSIVTDLELEEIDEIDNENSNANEVIELKEGFLIKDNQVPFSSGGSIIIDDNFDINIFNSINEITINDKNYSMEKLGVNQHFYYKNQGNLIFKDLSLFNKKYNEVIIKYNNLNSTKFIAVGIVDNIVSDDKEDTISDNVISGDKEGTDFNDVISGDKEDTLSDNNTELPVAINIGNSEKSISGNGGSIIFSENFDKEVLNNIESITVNDISLTLGKDIFIERSFFMGGEIRFSDSNKYFNKDKNIVIIKYNGYKDSIFTVLK